MTMRIGTNEAAFVIEKLRAADGTKLPPVFLLLWLGGRRIGWAHNTIRLRTRGSRKREAFRVSTIAKEFPAIIPSLA